MTTEGVGSLGRDVVGSMTYPLESLISMFLPIKSLVVRDAPGYVQRGADWSLALNLPKLPSFLGTEFLLE